MWTALISLAATLLGKLFGGGKDKTADMARELGAAEKENATMKGGIETIRAAEKAAKQAEQEATDEPDPMDRANRR